MPPDTETAADQPDSNENENQDEDALEAPDAQPERKPEFLKYDLQLAAYEQQKVDYELALTKFEQESENFEKRIEDGQKLVDELNERFADWYYVITAENLKTLQTTRKDLVSIKEKKGEGHLGAPDSEEVLPMKPDISFPSSDLDDEPAAGSGSTGDGQSEDSNSVNDESSVEGKNDSPETAEAEDG